jgi:hypothetical protein
VKESTTFETYLGEQARENEQETVWLDLALKYSPEIADIFTEDSAELEEFWKDLKGERLSRAQIVKRWETRQRKKYDL